MQNFLRLHYADSPPAVTYNSNFFGKKFFVQNQQADMSENSRSSEYSGGENSNSSEYSGGPKKWQNLLRIFGLLRKFWRFRNFWLEVFWRFKKLLVQSRSNVGSTLVSNLLRGSTGIRIHIFSLVSISGHRYANDMIKSVLERWKFWYFFTDHFKRTPVLETLSFPKFFFSKSLCWRFWFERENPIVIYTCTVDFDFKRNKKL